MEIIYAAIINWKVSKTLNRETIIKILEAAGSTFKYDDIDSMIYELSKLDMDRITKRIESSPIPITREEVVVEEKKEEDIGIMALFKEEWFFYAKTLSCLIYYRNLW